MILNPIQHGFYIRSMHGGGGVKITPWLTFDRNVLLVKFGMEVALDI